MGWGVFGRGNVIDSYTCLYGSLISLISLFVFFCFLGVLILIARDLRAEAGMCLGFLGAWNGRGVELGGGGETGFSEGECFLWVWEGVKRRGQSGVWGGVGAGARSPYDFKA